MELEELSGSPALLRMEKRFAANARLRRKYTMFMEELFSMGHMEPAETRDKVYYMPHHAVVKTPSQTTKPRIFFNASTSGNSLNDALIVGPQL